MVAWKQRPSGGSSGRISEGVRCPAMATSTDSAFIRPIMMPARAEVNDDYIYAEDSKDHHDAKRLLVVKSRLPVMR